MFWYRGISYDSLDQARDVFRRAEDDAGKYREREMRITYHVRRTIGSEFSSIVADPRFQSSDAVIVREEVKREEPILLSGFVPPIVSTPFVTQDGCLTAYFKSRDLTERVPTSEMDDPGDGVDGIAYYHPRIRIAVLHMPDDDCFEDASVVFENIFDDEERETILFAEIDRPWDSRRGLLLRRELSDYHGLQLVYSCSRGGEREAGVFATSPPLDCGTFETRSGEWAVSAVVG